MCQGLLLALERALDDFFESLKQDYDATEQRMVFVSVFSQSFLQVRFFCFEKVMDPLKLFAFTGSLVYGF